MLKINIICSYPFPGPSAAAQRVEAFVKTLSKDNLVRVFTINGDNLKDSSEIKFNENVAIYRINHPEYSRTNFFKRSFNEALISYKLSRLSSKHKSDYTVTTIPFMFLIQTTVLFGGKTKKILDVRDLVWEYLSETSFFQRFIKKTLRSIMLIFIKRYDHITTSNSSEIKWIKKKAEYQDVTLVSNGISLEKFKELCTITDNFEHSSSTRILYVGNVGLAQKVDTLVESVKNLKEVDVTIAGDGNDFKRVKDYADENEIGNVTFTGHINFDEILSFYKNHDILYAQLDKSYSNAVPSKLYEYLSTGLPIIYGGEGTAADLLENFENVHIIPPCDPIKLRKTIEDLKKQPTSISRKNIEDIRKTYLREIQSEKLLKIIGDKR